MDANFAAAVESLHVSFERLLAMPPAAQGQQWFAQRGALAL